MKHFTRRNEPFTCEHCKQEVPAHLTSSRDHCNHCLWGKHVDNFPGDRLNECHGMMQPIGILIQNGKTQLVYRCQKCGKQGRNIVAVDDNSERLVQISKLVWK